MTKKAVKTVAAAKKIPGEKKTAAMGRWAWPQQRYDDDGRELPYEKSTELEDELYHAIDGHFDGNGSITDDDAAKLINFMKKGMYSDVLHPPKHKIMMRGLRVPTKWVAKILGYKDVDKLPNKGKIEKNFTFKPKKGGATSWTHKKNIATEFAGDLKHNYYFSGDCGLLMYASVDDNPNKFLAGPGGLYDLQGPNSYNDEFETVGLGPIKVMKIAYVRYDKIYKKR